MGSVGRDIQRIQDWLSKNGGSTGSVKAIDISKMGNISLQDIENIIRNKNHEELYVFDKNNNLIAGYKGNSSSVAFPSNLLNQSGVTVTHGHPKGMAEFGGTFSFKDVNNMLNSKWAEHRVTASGQGEMNYIMRATAKADSNGLRTRINRDYTKLISNISKTYRDSYKQAVSSGKSRSQAMHIARQSAVGTLNRYYKDVMPKYGYEYITRKESYRYGR